MAHFIGRVIGTRNEASRLGSKKSGVTVRANGWNIGGYCSAQYNADKDRDEVTFHVTRGSNGNGNGLKLGTYFINSEGKIQEVDE